MRGLLLLCAAGIAYPARAHAEPRDSDAGPVASARRELQEAEALAQRGDHLACARLLAPIMWQLTAVSDADLAAEIEHTFQRCNTGLDRRFRRIKPGECRLKIDGAIAKAAAPAALLPRGTKSACLALVPGPPRKTALPGHEGDVCPRVALVWSAGKLRRRELLFDSGPLGDELWCCHLDSIAAGTLDGHTVVRISGTGHPCDGGTAVEASDALYQWNGSALVSPMDMSIEFH
ncbi:MAG TPA: hypothetical protein VHW23_25545 [Kofleriaceae bacterium]|jgi:hypothetical protein|nr:hypothetical protein [Kofleriaceae bacterium]